ncbi:MAG TPA: methyltransferase domain-containing protein [Polyangia bacterium]
MDDRERAQLYKGTFDEAAAGYDHPALHYFAASAEAMADRVALAGDEHVLDVAAGTGHTAVSFARRVPRGKVTAIDISPAMLAIAKSKAIAAGLHNVDVREMNILDLEFPDRCFDVAVCAYGIFFVEDMLGLLRGIAAKVKPGGPIIVSTFTETSFAPLAGLLVEQLARYGVPVAPMASKRVASAEQCERLFAQAGLAQIDSITKPLSYYLPSAEDWWALVMGAAFRGLVAQLPNKQVQVFRREHIDAVSRLATSEGIWLEVSAILTRGVVKSD